VWAVEPQDGDAILPFGSERGRQRNEWIQRTH